MNPYADKNLEQLKTMHRKAKTAQMTVALVFSLIILLWIVLGYWQSNLPVFISTIVLAAVVFLTASQGPKRIGNEITRRASSDQTT